MEKELKDIKKLVDEVKSLTGTINDVNFEISEKITAINRQISDLTGSGKRLQLDGLLVRKIAAELTATGDLNDACRAVANETGLSFDCVYFAFTHAKQIRKVLDRYALAFCVVRLKKAGLNANQISDLLQLSVQYVYKLQKIRQDLPDSISGKDFITRKV